MIDKMDLFCFSPTGGTAEVGKTFANAMADVVEHVDLCADRPVADPGDGFVAVAAPVFGEVVEAALRTMLVNPDDPMMVAGGGLLARTSR